MTIFRNYLDRLIQANTDADAAQSGASVPDSRWGGYTNTPTVSAVNGVLGDLVVDVEAGTDITLDGDGIHLHLAPGTYLVTGGATVAGDLHSMTDLVVRLGIVNGGPGDVPPSASASAAVITAGEGVAASGHVRAEADCTVRLIATPVGAIAPVSISGSIEIVRVT